MASMASVSLSEGPNDGRARLACGFSHSLALIPGKEDVYVWGKGEPSGSGRAGALSRIYEETIDYPQRVGSFVCPVVSVHAGTGFSVLLHENGSLTSWGAPPTFSYGDEYYLYEDLRKTNSTFWGERMLNNPASRSVKITQVACGVSHILLVDAKGRTFSWGSGLSGALGHGNLQDCVVAKQILDLKDHVVTSIGAGARHSLCSTAEGVVFSWGNGENAKLGLKDAVGKGVPTRLDLNVLAASVACGESHSALVTPQGELYVWGAGAFGRLGLGFECGDIVTPSRVDALWNADEVVCHVSLGMLHSGCITRSTDGTRRLFLWGSGSCGKLGPAPSDSNQLLPFQPFPRYQGFKEVRCGSSHTLVLMESGEVLSMGMEGASWIGQRKKATNPVSLGDFCLNAFEFKEGGVKAIRRTGYGSSNANRVLPTYVIDIDESEWPALTSEATEARNVALRTFIEKGLLPKRAKSLQEGKYKVATDIIQKILWSHPWNGDSGVSESSLQGSKDALTEKRYHLRVECSRLNELLDDVMQLDRSNGKAIRNYLRSGRGKKKTSWDAEERGTVGSTISGGGLGINARAERHLNMDATGLFSFRGLTSKRKEAGELTVRNPFDGGDATEKGDGCLGCCLPLSSDRRARKMRIKQARRRLELEDRTFFTNTDFERISIILSYLLANSDKMYLFWSSLNQPHASSLSVANESKTTDLFLGLCRDLYIVSDKRSERLFHKLLKEISVATLETAVEIKNKDAHVNSALVYKDGLFPRLMRNTYLTDPTVKTYVAKRVQSFLDLVVQVRTTLDFDPFTVSLSLSDSKNQKDLGTSSEVSGGLIYLKPPEDQLPLDIREANAKRRHIFETKPEVRRAMEANYGTVERLVGAMQTILVEMAATLPFSMGVAMAEYHDTLMWCFTLREEQEICVLAVMRTLFHLLVVPALTRPEQFDLALPDEKDAPKELHFNLIQIMNLVDQCFVVSKAVFESPWFGPMPRLAKSFSEAMASQENIVAMRRFPSSLQLASPAFSSSTSNGVIQVSGADIVEAALLKETVAEWLRTDPFVLYPSRRTLEFLKHRAVPFLVNAPNVSEIGDYSELQIALEHFMEALRPPSAKAASIRELGAATRRKMFARTQGITQSRKRLLSGLGLSRSALPKELDKDEEERRINYADFIDDWGYALPVNTRLESLDKFLETVARGGGGGSSSAGLGSPPSNQNDHVDSYESNEQFLSESSEVIARATEILVAFPLPSASDFTSRHSPSLSGNTAAGMKPLASKRLASSSSASDSVKATTTTAPEEFSLWMMMLQHLPEFELELAKYASGTSVEERESSFTNNLLEKVLLMYIEKVQLRVALSFKNRVFDGLLVDVKQTIHAMEERKQLLEQFQDVLHKGNGFTQNRKAVEYFATEARVKLTDVVNMVPESSPGIRRNRGDLKLSTRGFGELWLFKSSKRES